MRVSIANLSDDVRVACRKYVRSRGLKAEMGRVLGAGGYEFNNGDLADLVVHVLADVRQDQDYAGMSQWIDVDGGTALAKLLAGTLSGAADYIVKQIRRRLEENGVEIVP